jgi:hypothetical protein
MLNVIMLSVVTPFELNGTVRTKILSVFMLSVFLLNVLASKKQLIGSIKINKVL